MERVVQLSVLGEEAEGVEVYLFYDRRYPLQLIHSGQKRVSSRITLTVFSFTPAHVLVLKIPFIS